MDTNDNKKVIEKLENVQALLYEWAMKKNFLEYESDVKYGEKTAEFRSTLGELEIPLVFSSFPVFPIDASYCAAVMKDKQGKEKIFKITLIATIILLVLYFLTHWDFLNTIGVLGIFASAILGYFYNISKKEYNKKKSIYDKSVEKFNKTNKEFLSALEVFEEEKSNCISAAKKYAENYAIAYDKSLDAFLKKVEEDTEAENRIEQIKKELSENDVITPEFYHLIDNIISNLKSGRADDYKEALNIAIREEKEENERRIRLQQEEERNRILAMQAEEERRHNEQLERQQREHDAAVLREQRRQNDAVLREQRQQSYEAQRQADRAASEARKQANATKQAGISKCASCANARHCPSHVKNNGSGLTCGGYVPYGAKR